MAAFAGKWFRAFDGHGNEIPYPIDVDLGSERVERYATDEDGRVVGVRIGNQLVPKRVTERVIGVRVEPN
jgi:hypothetical protein